jgi:hypothetical protein
VISDDFESFDRDVCNECVQSPYVMLCLVQCQSNKQALANLRDQCTMTIDGFRPTEVKFNSCVVISIEINT